VNSKTIKTAKAPIQTPEEIAADKTAAVVAPLLEKLADVKAKADAQNDIAEANAAKVAIVGPEAADTDVIMPTVEASGPHNDGKNAPVWVQRHDPEAPPPSSTPPSPYASSTDSQRGTSPPQVSN